MRTESTHAQQVETQPLLELVEQLQQFSGGPQEFLHHLLTLQCQIALAKAGALLRVAPEGRLEVLAVYPVPEEGAPDPVWLAKAWRNAFSVAVSVSALELANMASMPVAMSAARSGSLISMM